MTASPKLLISALLIVFNTGFLFSQEANYLWHRSYEDCSSGGLWSQILTEDNELYILAGHSGILDTDPSPYDSMPGSGLTLIKYDQQRRYLWHRQVASANESMAMKRDSDGNIFIYGMVYNDFDGDPGPAVNTIYSGGSVLKYGADGDFFWAKQLHVNSNNANLNSMTIDPNGNLYMAGSFSTNFDADPSAAVHMMGSPGGYLVKWDNDGNYVNAFSFSNGNNAAAYEVESLDDKIFMSGSSYNLVDVNPAAGSFMVGENSASTGFIALYDTTLVFVNAVTLQNGGQRVKTSVSATGLTLTGVHNQTFDANPGAGVANLANPSFNYLPYFIRFNTSLAYQFGAYMTTNDFSNQSYVYDVAQKTNGEFFMLATYNRELDVNPGAGTFIVSNIDGNTENLYVAHYSNTGAFIEARALTNQYMKNGGEISCSEKSRFFVGGAYRGSIDLNPAVANEENQLNGVNAKPFLVELSTIAPQYITINDTICAGDSYPFGDRSYTESGRYLHRFELANGSDSIVTLNLQVNKVNTGFDVSATYIVPHETNAASYSLFNCATGLSLGAFTADSIQPATNDPVSLVISMNGCTDTSECVQVSLSSNTSTPELAWGDDLSRVRMLKRSMTTDLHNNVYVAGMFDGLNNVKLFNGQLYVHETPNSGDFIVSKYDENGAVQWAYTMGMQGTSAISEAATFVKVDNAGNVFVAGRYEETVDMENDEMYLNNMADLTPAGCCSYQAFILKLNEHGQVVWFKRFFAASNDQTNIHDIAFDSHGNFGIIGYSDYAPTDLDPNGGVTMAPTKGTFFGKYTPDGNFLYGHSIDRDPFSPFEECMAIRFDSQDNMIVTGRFDENADFDPSGATLMLNGSVGATGGYTFLAKYNPGFQLQWARMFGKNAGSSTIDADMEIDGNDNILLMTGLGGANTFPNELGGVAQSVNFWGNYLVRFNPQGGFNKLYTYRTLNFDDLAFDLDNYDNIYLAGNLFSGSTSVTFAAGNTMTLTNGGTYVAKYHPEEGFKYSFSVADGIPGNSNRQLGIECDESGHFYLGSRGFSTNTFDIDPSAGTTMLQSPESYLAKYGETCTPFTANITLSSNTLTATPANAWYEWYRATDNLLMQSGFDNTFSSCGAGQFYCIVKQGECSATSNTLSLASVSQNAVAAASNDPVCTNVWNFGVSISGICPDSYAWYVNGVLVATTDSLTLTSPQQDDSVYCVVQDVFGAQFNTNAIELNVIPQTASLTTSVDPVCAQIIEFNATTNGMCPDIYSWYVNGDFVQTSAGFTLTGAQDGDSVYCIVEDLFGNEIVSDTTVIDIEEPIATLDMVNDTICPGADLLVNLNLQNACPDTYSWYVNGVLAATTQSATIDTPENGDLIYCIVEDLFGDLVYSDTFEVNVYPPNTPVVTLWTDSLAATAGFATYQWLDCTTGNPIAGANDNYYLPTATGDYAVIATTAEGCADTSNCVHYDDISAVVENPFAGLVVYPNPTDGKLFIELTGIEGEVTVTLLDAAGRTIAEPKSVSGTSFEMTIAGADGMYILELKHASGSKRIRVVKE